MQHIKNQKNIFFLCNENHSTLNGTFFEYICKQPAYSNLIGNQVFFDRMCKPKISHTVIETVLDDIWWRVREHERSRFIWGAIQWSDILNKYEFNNQ